MAELLRRVIISQVPNVFIQDLDIKLRNVGDSIDLLKPIIAGTNSKKTRRTLEQIGASHDLDTALANGWIRLIDQDGIEITSLTDQLRATNLLTLRESDAGGSSVSSFPDLDDVGDSIIPNLGSLIKGSGTEWIELSVGVNGSLLTVSGGTPVWSNTVLDDYVQNSFLINTTSPLIGGGDLTSNLTLSINISATDKILGRFSSGAGNAEEITCTSFARSILDDTTAAAVRTTIGAGTGDVVGPSVAEDNIIARFDGTTGKLIQSIDTLMNGSGTMDDSGNIKTGSLKLLDGSGAGPLSLAIKCATSLSLTDRTLNLTVPAASDHSLTLTGTSSSLTGTNTGDQTISLTGDVTGSGVGSFAATIANDAVTYAKIQNVSVTDRILGRSSSGGGDIEEIICTSAGRALLDDADSTAQRATLGLVIGTDVQAYDIELAALAGLTSAANKLPYFTGSGTAGLVDFTPAGFSLTLSANTTIGGTNTGDQTISLTGDVTGSGTGSFAATIANDAVTFAKMQNIATASFLGRSTSGTGDPEVLTVSQATALLLPSFTEGSVLFVGSGGSFSQDNSGLYYVAATNRLKVGTTDVLGNDPGLYVMVAGTAGSDKNVILGKGNRGNSGTVSDNTNIGLWQGDTTANNYAFFVFYNGAGYDAASVGVRFIDHDSTPTGDLFLATANNSSSLAVPRFWITRDGKFSNVQTGQSFLVDMMPTSNSQEGIRIKNLSSGSSASVIVVAENDDRSVLAQMLAPSSGFTTFGLITADTAAHEYIGSDRILYANYSSSPFEWTTGGNPTTTTRRMALANSGELRNYYTTWKDYSILSTVAFNSGWTLTTDGLLTAVDAVKMWVPLHYQPGTILSRLRVKYSGTDASTGVIVTLRKRDESSTTTTYTTVGAAQTMLNSGVVVTTYDFANETISANTSYEIMFESEIPVGQTVTLYAWGIETTERVI